jgi:hypothetical protein
MGKWTDALGHMVRGNFNFGFYSLPSTTTRSYTYGKQCDGGGPVGDAATPRYDGPPPAP